jgi:hypothetical protein
MDERLLGTVMGTIRTGTGASLVVAPAWAGRIWIGEHADGRGTRVLARALGARDVVLGSATLLASAKGASAEVVRLVQLGALADAADVAATLIAWRQLEGHRRWSMPLVALGVGLAGAAAAVAIQAAAESSEVAPAADGAGAGDADGHDAAAAAGIVDQQGAVLAEIDEQANGRTHGAGHAGQPVRDRT